MKLPPVLAVLSFSLGSLFADVSLPAIFSDHMVLRSADGVPIWGKADPGEKVAIEIGGRKATAEADASGRWSARLDLSGLAKGPFEMSVTGKNSLRIADVILGEVWLASGQSNMEWSLGPTLNSEEEIAASANPEIRQFLVTRNAVAEPAGDVKGSWTVASPETAGKFTAVGYYFAKMLNQRLNVPVGVINSTWGGTAVEPWTSMESIATQPDLKQKHDAQSAVFKKWLSEWPAFPGAFQTWLKNSGREDVRKEPVLATESPEASEWKKITLPGEVLAEGFPKTGVVWLRADVEIPAEQAGSTVALDLGEFTGFESFYWNGKLIGEQTPQKFAGNGAKRRYEVPAASVVAGKNQIALRFFSPFAPAKLSAVPRLSGAPISDWFARVETAFPDPTSDQLASLPPIPQAPPGAQTIPTFLFNGMISPLVPYALSGVIWYQGESNAGRAWDYRRTFPLLIKDWRKAWNRPDLPFYFCQLANYQDKSNTPGDSSWAELREAQSSTLALPNTGQAVLIDVGEAKDIHPRNKKTVGERLAKIALSQTYGLKNEVSSGPVYQEMKVEDGKIRILFKTNGSALKAGALPESYVVNSSKGLTAPLVRNTPDSELEGFSLCGEDGKWVWANAKIDGDSVLVWSEVVPKPTAVRYGWQDNPTVNLTNTEGLPASPFRTDDFPATTLSKTP